MVGPCINKHYTCMFIVTVNCTGMIQCTECHQYSQVWFVCSLHRGAGSPMTLGCYQELEHGSVYQGYQSHKNSTYVLLVQQCILAYICICK